MREEIKESVARTTADDRKDIAITCGLQDESKPGILKAALADEEIAEYVLQY